jgi:outer membrane protein TolC
MIIKSYKFRQIIFMVSLLFICSLKSFAAENVDSKNHILDLETSVNIALKDNPNLAQIFARYKAFSKIPSQVGSLPDPKLSLGAMNLPTSDFSTSAEPMTQMQIGFSQAFPFPGKLSLKAQAAKYEAAAANNDAEEIRLQLIKQVKSSWWEVYFLDRSVNIVDNNIKLLRNFVKIAQTKYKVGKGLQQDVLLAQLELSKLLDQKIQLEAFRENEAAKLNTLMGKKANEKVKLPEKVSLNLPQIPSNDILFDEAKVLKPTLIKNRNLTKAARSRLKLADKEYYPDFNIGVNYGDRSGNNPGSAGGGRRGDFASVMLTMTIPFYTGTKQSQGVEQRRYELSQNESLKQDTYNSIQMEITQSSSNYNKSKKQFELFRSGILPQARQTVNSMLSGYKVSQVDFLNLIGSQVTLFNYEIKYWQSLARANQFLAKLEATVGIDNIYNISKTINKSSDHEE